LKLNQQGEIKEHIHPAGVKLPPHPQKKKKKRSSEKHKCKWKSRTVGTLLIQKTWKIRTYSNASLKKSFTSHVSLFQVCTHAFYSFDLGANMKIPERPGSSAKSYKKSILRNKKYCCHSIFPSTTSTCT